MTFGWPFQLYITEYSSESFHSIKKRTVINSLLLSVRGDIPILVVAALATITNLKKNIFVKIN